MVSDTLHSPQQDIPGKKNLPENRTSRKQKKNNNSETLSVYVAEQPILRARPSVDTTLVGNRQTMRHAWNTCALSWPPAPSPVPCHSGTCQSGWTGSTVAVSRGPSQSRDGP